MVQPNPGAQLVTPLVGTEIVDLLGVGWNYTTVAAIAAAPASSPQKNAGTVSTTNPSTTREIWGQLTLNYAGAVTVGSGSGSAVGVRGEVTLGNAATVLGASYVYGVQGKVDAVTGATGGAGAHIFGVVGQFDFSLGHITGNPQISPIWGDMGATSPSDGWGTNSSLLSGQNTTAAPTNSHLYTYGAASYLWSISSNSGAFVTTGAATPSGTMKKLKVNIDGTDLYVLAAATWS